jgi:hypothetical protein
MIVPTSKTKTISIVENLGSYKLYFELESIILIFEFGSMEEAECVSKLLTKEIIP